jgi:hypothetical protein
MHSKNSKAKHSKEMHWIRASAGKHVRVCVFVLVHTCVKFQIVVVSEETNDKELLKLYTIKS